MDKKKQFGKNPEGFPEPRTFPNAWDGSALVSKNEHRYGSGEEVVRNEGADNIEWHPEEFPKPRTYPKNWSIDD